MAREERSEFRMLPLLVNEGISDRDTISLPGMRPGSRYGTLIHSPYRDPAPDHTYLL
jgi:hypothetical protein